MYLIDLCLMLMRNSFLYLQHIIERNQKPVASCYQEELHCHYNYQIELEYSVDLELDELHLEICLNYQNELLPFSQLCP
jgi:hypothetical protein